MTTIAFIDTACPAPYDGLSTTRGGLGGTEASIVRLAEALSANAEITVLQHCREDSARSANGVVYQGYRNLRELARDSDYDHVIIINSPKVLQSWTTFGKASRLWLWVHNYPGRNARRLGQVVLKANATVIAVSQTHRETIRNFVQTHEKLDIGQHICAIYNPVVAEPVPAQETDPNRLIYLSSPHKGLREVIEAFQIVRLRRPQARLYVGNPGYQPDADLSWASGCVPLPPASHPQTMQMLQTSFCLFYPQTHFAETFGLVMAEANALGTPVIAHKGLGANDEIVADDRQLLDCSDPQAVVERLMQWWTEGPPLPRTNTNFGLAAVCEEWRSLLGLNAAQTYRQAS